MIAETWQLRITRRIAVAPAWQIQFVARYKLTNSFRVYGRAQHINIQKSRILTLLGISVYLSR